MTRTERFTLCLGFVAGIILLTLFLITFARAGAAPAEPCDPAYTAQCCACEPSGVAEPAPPQRIFLPLVQQRMPAMSAESTPLQPVPTVTPDPPVSGDVQ